MVRFQKYYKALAHKLESYSTTYLSQKDFDEGTYRITEPGKYVLTEDILFEPNASDNWMPRADQDKYAHKAYTLGFFAAITIESPYVILNLNEHSIKQSKVHALQQRFYAHIELTNTPFLKGQGPADFGAVEGSAIHTIIHNGHLGRSSHHGIHGNKVEGVLFHNLKIDDFEVAGIAVNGFEHVGINYVDIGPTRTDIPVNARYSAGRFLDLLGRAWLQDHQDAELAQTLDQLEKELNTVLQYIQLDQALPANNLFAMPYTNGLQITDGGVYGIVANVPGIAVNDFLDSTYTGAYSKELHLDHVHIHDLASNVTEVATLSQQDGTGAITDASGSVIRYNDYIKPEQNIVVQAQLAAAKAGLNANQAVGRTNITQDVIDWAEDKLSLSELQDKGYQIVGNGDSMFHVGKGNHGIRMDGVVKSKLKHVYVKNIINCAALGSTLAGTYKLSQSVQKKPGYCCADVSGISFAQCFQIRGYKTHVSNLRSYNGKARGIRYTNQNDQIELKRTFIENVKAGYLYKQGCWYGFDQKGKLVLYSSCLPNLIPMAFGIIIEADSENPPGKLEHPGLEINQIEGVGVGFPYTYLTLNI